jgi:putative heme-binding domain-containing protein
MNQSRWPARVGGVVVLLTAIVASSLCEAAEVRPAWTTSKIQGTPQPPAPYAIRPAFPLRKFQNPTSLEELPDGRILVSEIGGELFTFLKKDKQSGQKDLLLKIEGSPRVWHATVHPKFASNRLLFVCYSKNGTSHVSRFRVEGSPPVADPKSEVVLITWPAGGHNAGCLRFGTDGMLYIATGDGSGPNPPDGRTAAQDVSNLFGCILRIDVDRKADGKNYAVPADNPFVDLAGARPEIWAYGLRNPWKFGVDSQTGSIFAADNGWESWEMVHRIVRGGNCGWPIMEGRALLRSEVERGPTPIRPPVKDHSHTEANSVIGGPVYRGSTLKDLDGTFIYGDYITGTIWGLKADGEDSYTHRTLVDTDQRITAFAEGSDGELFVLDYDYTGQIYELVPSGLQDRSADFPRRLSETGLFTSLESMTPAPGVVPYAVNVERWMDGFKSQRFVAIPGSGSISLGDGESPATYPEGTVFVKHVMLPKRNSPNSKDVPAETQILHYENGTWHPYSYVWNNLVNDEPHDATLVDAAGTDRQIVYAIGESGEFLGPNWHVSAENECRLCHNAGSGVVLGFVPNQLDRSYFGPPSRTLVDQLETLAAEKTIARQPEFPAGNPGRLVDPHDEKQSLDDRARSYLHSNCSSCHHRGGNAIVSFYLRREMPFDELNTDKGTGIGTFGIRNAKLIVPGDPYRSILLYRMSKLGYARMPYIGSSVVDSRGVALIEEWIRAMPHTSTEEDSTPVQPGSRDERALATVKRITRPLIEADNEPTNFLLESTEGALALASAIHAEKVSDIGAQRVYEKSGSDIRGLFETFVPPELRRKTLGRSIDPQTILSLDGDADRGRLIFFSDGARCRNCHDIDDDAKSTGPTLTEIRKQYKSNSEMLPHILNPSLKVDEKFATWVVATASGKVYNGLLISQSDDEVVLQTAERTTIRVKKSEIDEMQKSPRSLMPEGILSDLTAQEAADLLRWFGAN